MESQDNNSQCDNPQDNNPQDNSQNIESGDDDIDVCEKSLV